MGVLWKTLQPRAVGMVPDGTICYMAIEATAVNGPLSDQYCSILLDYIYLLYIQSYEELLVFCTAMEPGFLDEHQLEARMGAPSKNQAFSMNKKKKQVDFILNSPFLVLDLLRGPPKNRTYALIRFPKWWMF